MKETPRRITTVTSSLNEITIKLGKRVMLGGIIPTATAPFYSRSHCHVFRNRLSRLKSDGTKKVVSNFWIKIFEDDVNGFSSTSDICSIPTQFLLGSYSVPSPHGRC
jgi:hypothetical protein